MDVRQREAWMTFLWILYFAGKCYSSFSVKENQAANAYLGNIVDSEEFPTGISEEDRNGMKYYFLKGSVSLSNYFTLNEATGAISTAMPLDREMLCKESDPCVITLDVALSTKTIPVKIFRVDVVVEDENDNSPVFPQQETHLNIFEDATIDTELPIPTARDPDAGENSVVTYSIEPFSEIFEVVVTQTLEGAPGAALVLKKNLDHEKVDSYNLRVVAEDGGLPKRSGVMSVVISVIDVNDNSPVFNKLPFNLTIQENSRSGTPVMSITATDQDTGENGRVSYRFTPRSTLLALGVFEINTTSGEIILMSNLDYEETKSYRLIVEAYDGGSPSKTTQALLTVNVTDVNDNHPVLNINYLPGQSHAEISESARAGSFVALYISAADRDAGVNAIVDCSFENPDFRIEKHGPNEYQVSVKRNLDREHIANYSIQISCQDRGNPTRAGSADVVIHLTDVNDNAPLFSQDIFPLMVEETLGVGQSIITLSAYDPDEGDNARIRYEIVSSEPVTGLFSINPVTGVMSVAKMLDRESVSEVNLVVTATDHGNPARRARTSVNVSILDVNDEYPSFNETKYDFVVVENSPPDIWVGRVHATDTDSGLGGQVKYRLSGESKDMFSINSESGEIRTLQGLDREKHSVVPVSVVAFDAGTPSLSSTMTLNVFIQDLNDNVPVFTFPSSGNETLVINKHSTPGIIAKVNATDPDLHSALSFYLHTNSEVMFFINRSSGEISVTQSLAQFKNGSTFKLNLTVSDNGTPELSTTTTLYLTIGTTARRDVVPSAVNMYIVATVLSLTVLIALVVAVVIVCIRNKDFMSKRREKQQRLDRNKNANVNNRQANFPSIAQHREPYVQQNLSKNTEVYGPMSQMTNAEIFRVAHTYQKAPQKTWLIGSASSQASMDARFKNVERSLSDLSDRTFDSGKGGSNNSMEMRIRGDNSPVKELHSPRGTNNTGEVYHQRHTLASSGEVFIKTADTPWKRVEIYDGAISRERRSEEMHEADAITDQHSYYSTHNFNGQSVFV